MCEGVEVAQGIVDERNADEVYGTTPILFYLADGLDSGVPVSRLCRNKSLYPGHPGIGGFHLSAIEKKFFAFSWLHLNT